MCSAKRVRLLTLLLTVAAVLAGTSVFGGKFGRVPGGDVAKLVPPLDSDEPYASGQAKLSNITEFYDSWWGYRYAGELSLTCNGLTPGATYNTPVGSFTASDRGTGKVAGLTWFWTGNSFPVVVSREEQGVDANGNVIIIWVEVLEGTVVRP